MPLDDRVFSDSDRMLHSLEKELDRATQEEIALQTRINTVLIQSGVLSGALVAIWTTIRTIAETNSALQPFATYLPIGGLISMFLAWGFSKGVRSELRNCFRDAAIVEKARSEILSVPVRRFTEKYNSEISFWGVHRETWVILLITVGWAVIAYRSNLLPDLWKMLSTSF